MGAIKRVIQELKDMGWPVNNESLKKYNKLKDLKKKKDGKKEKSE
jgi:hypothetical protein|tara:strand:- start:644 stop:778 length:135 start_codon:yes stop_codon:yes gene_type:complete